MEDMKQKLNLGCGNDYRQGYINIDISPLCYSDMELDLNETPYPFNNHCIDEIIMYDVLEHLENPIDVLRECQRILIPNGKLFIRIPNKHWGFIDPTHKTFWTYWTFDFFDRRKWLHKKYGFYYFNDIHFVIKKKKWRWWNLYFKLETEG